MQKILIVLSLIGLASCSSSLTKINKGSNGEIVRELHIAPIEKVREATDSIKDSVPVRVKLYHMPFVLGPRLKMINNWDQPPHIYEYDYAEEQYTEKYVMFDVKNIEKSESMNIIDYINSNIKDPSGFQQNHNKRFLLGL